MQLKSYFVSNTAGPVIGGVLNPGAGNSIKLNELQAAQPLRKGEISLEKQGKKSPPPPPAEDSKKTDKGEE